MSDKFAAFRQRMVETQLVRRGIRDPRTLEAMRAVPRERFVAQNMAEFAYEDGPLPIAEGQTISQPYVVALMIEAAGLNPASRALEIGAGSGYAAAVMSRLAQRVFAIERFPALAEEARRRLEALGYENVEIRAGDGTLGWPEAAPFDAVIVSAGGPEVPLALKRQLAVGGSLVVPVGTERHSQRLKRVTRTGENDFTEEDLGGVAFVPLVGAHGWSEEGTSTAGSHIPHFSRNRSVPELIADAAEPLTEIGDERFADAIARFAGRRIVMLGEASHGTSEFYRARAAFTKRLIAEHGFRILAVEADWPDAAAIDRWIGHRPPREKEAPPFQRFPTWMWRNREMLELWQWIRDFNESREDGDRVGFYGLDLYNMSASITAVLAYLEEHDPEAAAVARERYGCLTPWQRDPATYGRAVLRSGTQSCEQAVVAQCRDMLESCLEDVGESLLDAAQNARLVASAEKYYRIMYHGGAESWNLRDRHMAETLGLLLKAREGARAVVWAHNSHVGDARFTEMGIVRQEWSLGQLARERWGKDVALIGLGTHAGTVAAATDWNGAMEMKEVRPSHPDSIERLMHDAGLPCFFLDFTRPEAEAARERLIERRLQRFIGVIYRPETELRSHYMDASLPQQFDVWLWFDRTSAVTPLGGAEKRSMPDTFPFGL
ncbi:MAG: protein-L-isoaspartate(D-aspartate) O-methyltransferase [Methylobacterium mesophilicum]|nr:protein-L-isoaspartate(D-aspartate) O-methyltransferase [Methylobacterium mesophilicum]